MITTKWDILVPEMTGFTQDTLAEEVEFILKNQFFTREDWAGYTEHFKDRKSYKYRIKLTIENL